MSRGGRRPGAGRPKGAISLSTRAILESMATGGEMPIAYMLRVMRDDDAPDARRDEMARLAAPYLHPRVSVLPEDVEETSEAEAAWLLESEGLYGTER
jgi:hypothetical protein